MCVSALFLVSYLQRQHIRALKFDSVKVDVYVPLNFGHPCTREYICDPFLSFTSSSQSV